MVKALHSARDRGDPRRRLQPHRRGQPPRADARLQGDRQPLLLPHRSRRPALLHGLHGHRQLAQPGAPVGAAADHGLAPLLRDRVPRRRLPLRPRVGARARVPRGRPALGLLRHHPPGSDPVPGEADRGAVGRRRGRLPGRQLPGALDRVERDVPRHDARLLARPERRSASSPRASRARATSTRRTAGSRSRRSTSSPRTTASRCATSSPTTTSTTRRTSRTTRTATTTTGAGTTASRARPTTRRSTPCASARCGTSWRRSSSRRACRCCSAATRSRGRSSGNNNAYCQDNEISWIDWQLDGRAERDARVHEAADRAPLEAPGLPPRRLPHRRGADGLGRAGRLVVPGGRPEDDAAQLARRQRAHARRLPQRLRDPDPQRRRVRR